MNRKLSTFFPHICMDGIRGDINLSSKGVKFRHSVFTEKFC